MTVQKAKGAIIRIIIETYSYAGDVDRCRQSKIETSALAAYAKNKNRPRRFIKL